MLFRFETGEHRGETYLGEYQVCANPQCTCSEVWMNLRYQSDVATEKDEYRFALNVVDRKVSQSADSLAGSRNENFAKAVAANLTDQEWDALHREYWSAKVDATEAASPEEIQHCFEYSKIEERGVLVTVKDVLPYAAPIVFDANDRKQCVYDSYCVRPACTCKEAFLEIVPVDPSKRRHSLQADEIPNILLDYATGTWKTAPYEHRSRKELSPLVEAMFEQLPSIRQDLKKRHERLRAIFLHNLKKDRPGPKLFRVQTPVEAPLKVGRNDPCPCGSGRKFKACCMTNRSGY